MLLVLTKESRLKMYPHCFSKSLTHRQRKSKRILFSQLTISGKMNEYLADIDRQAEEMFCQLVKQLAEKESITETLKAADQIEWVRRMNAIREQATEIVNNELIYN